MKIIIVGVMQEPQIAEIKGNFDSMKNIVGESIQINLRPHDSSALVRHSEGSWLELPIARKFYCNGELVDIVHGTFFVCGTSLHGDHFISLTDEQIELYMEKFKLSNCESGEDGNE